MLAGLRRLLIVMLCVFGLGPDLALAQTAPMTFQTVRIGDSSVIVAMGQITEDTPAEFLAFVRQDDPGSVVRVLIDSPGGKVLASMEFGTLLRKIGATMIVGSFTGDDGFTTGQCFSACVYALMGARRRVVPPGSLIGIHRMFVYEQGMAANGEMLSEKRFDNGEMRAFLMRYSSSMGVSPNLIAAAERVPSEELRILTPSEIKRWHLGVPRL